MPPSTCGPTSVVVPTWNIHRLSRMANCASTGAVAAGPVEMQTTFSVASPVGRSPDCTRAHASTVKSVAGVAPAGAVATNPVLSLNRADRLPPASGLVDRLQCRLRMPNAGGRASGTAVSIRATPSTSPCRFTNTPESAAVSEPDTSSRRQYMAGWSLSTAARYPPATAPPSAPAAAATAAMAAVECSVMTTMWWKPHATPTTLRPRRRPVTRVGVARSCRSPVPRLPHLLRPQVYNEPSCMTAALKYVPQDTVVAGPGSGTRARALVLVQWLRPSCPCPLRPTLHTEPSAITTTEW